MMNLKEDILDVSNKCRVYQRNRLLQKGHHFVRLTAENLNLMHLFEGGILEKITSAEYAAQSRKIPKDKAEETIEQTAVQNVKDPANEKGNEVQNHSPSQGSEVITPLNLRMLQGAFIALGVGSLTAGSIFILEILFHQLALVQKIKHLWLRHLRHCFRHWGRFHLWIMGIFTPRLRLIRN